MKKIFALFVFFMLLVSPMSVVGFQEYVGFPPAPHPLGGTVKNGNTPLSGVSVSFINLRTSYTDSINTNSQGAYQFELSNSLVNSDFENPYQIGDQVRVTVAGESKTISLGPGSDFVSFDLSLDYKQCSDGSTVLIDTNCPDVPTPTPTPVEEGEINVITSSDKSKATFEVGYGKEFDLELADNKLSQLIDDELKHNGEKYDIMEKIKFKGSILTSIDNEDYITPRLVIPKKGLKYSYLFDEPIPFSSITDEDPLEIIFLGRPLLITSVSSTSFELRSGDSYTLSLNDCVSDVCLIQTGNDVARVKVKGVESSVKEGQLKTVNGVEVYVEDIWDDPDGATLLIGDDVKRVIDSGDGYKNEDDTQWIYEFTTESSKLTSISIVNKNDYTKVDNDEYLSLEEGDKIELPNGFAEFVFDLTPEYDVVELEFGVDDEYLYVSGNLEDSFTIGTDEYDELWIKNGFYNGDLELLTTSKVRIGDSDIFLELGSLIIGKLKMELDLSKITYDGIVYSAKDGDYMDHSGITFKNPEAAIEDKDGFVVLVPDTDQDIEVVLSVNKVSKEVETEPEEEVETEPSPVEVPIEVPEVEVPEEQPKAEPVKEEPPVIVTQPEIEPKSNPWIVIVGIVIVGIIVAGLGFWAYKLNKEE